MLRFLVTLTLLMCVAPAVWAACPDAANSAGYVRAGAAGTGTGADWTNAFTNLPGSLSRGCTYFVAAGTYNNKTFNDANSGSTTITVKAATIGVHGTNTGWNNAFQGQAVFRCANACAAIFDLSSTDFYVIDGVYCSNDVVGTPLCQSGYGFKLDNSNGKALADIRIGQGFGAPTNSRDFSHDQTIRYVELNGAHPTSDSSPLDLQFDIEGGSFNLLISHVFVHDGYVPFFIKGHHNHVNGSGYSFGSGDNITIEYAYEQNNYNSPAFHSEGCSCSEGLTNFTYRYNFDVNMIGTGYMATPSGGSFNSGNQGNGPWFIYGNVFMATTPSHCATGDGVLAVFDAQFQGDIHWYNNTIFNLGSGFCNGAIETGFGFGLGFTTPLQNLFVQNNLWFTGDPVTVIRTGTTSWQGASMISTTWSHNAYFKTPNGASSDPDSNKQASSTLNPFVSGLCCALINHTSNGFDTSARVPGNSVDMNGVTRGAGGIWDRGAFQLGAPLLVPTSPNTPTVVVH